MKEKPFLRALIDGLVAIMALVLCAVAIAADASARSAAVASSNLSSQVFVKPKAEAMIAWQEFKASHGPNWKLKWNKGTGLPEKLYGDFALPAAGNLYSAATTFLKENSKLLGLKQDLSDLALVGEKESVGGQHLYFNQTHRGVPIFHGGVSVHLDKANRVNQIDSQYRENIRANLTTPTVSQEAAIRLAQTGVNLKRGSYMLPKSALMLFPAQKEHRLAWQIIFNAVEPLGTWRVFVDARDGSILAVDDIAKSAVTGQGKVFDPNPVVKLKNNSLIDNEDLDSAVPSQAYSTVSLPDLNDPVGGLYRLEGQFVTMRNLEPPNNSPPATTNPNSFTYTRSQDQFEDTMVYFHLDRAQRYIQSLGFTDVNNRSIEVDAHGLNGIEDNSRYQPDGNGTGTIAFGDGGVDDAEDAEIILHEYGHAIQDNQVVDFGETLEGGSMGEGFGDWFAAVTLFPYSDGFQNECVGDWDATSYSTTSPPCLRRLDSPKHYPDDLDGEVHDDGEMWSASLWQIFLGLGGDMTARDAAMRIVLESHFLLTPTSQFRDGAEAIIQADQNLNSGANETLLRNVLENRGFLFEPQLLEYELKQDVQFDFVDISQSGMNIGINQDDQGFLVSIGFDFALAGDVYNSVIVSSNGYLTFTGPGDAYANSPLPSPGLPNGVVAPFWDDLNPEFNAPEAKVLAATVGTAPNRKFIVEWYRVPLYDDPESRLTFEAVLYESTGVMKFQYDTMTAGSTTLNRGDSATIGIESTSGTAGLAYAFNTPAAVRNGLALEFLPLGSSGEGEAEPLAEGEGEDVVVEEESGLETEEPEEIEAEVGEAEPEELPEQEEQPEEAGEGEGEDVGETEPENMSDLDEQEERVFEEDGAADEKPSPIEEPLGEGEGEDANPPEEDEPAVDQADEIVELVSEGEEETTSSETPTPPVLVDPMATLAHGHVTSRFLDQLRNLRDREMLRSRVTTLLVHGYYKTADTIVELLTGIRRMK